MKVVFVNSTYYPWKGGGSERSVQFLAETMVRAGHQAVVLTHNLDPKVRMGELNGVRIYYMPMRNLYRWGQRPNNPIRRSLWHLIDSYNPWMGHDVLRVLQAEKPDVVHTNMLSGFSVAVWDAAHRSGAALVHTLREFYLQCRLISLYRNNRHCQPACALCRIGSIAKRNRSSVPDAIIGISQYVLKSHLDAGFFDDVPIRQVIYNTSRDNTGDSLPPRKACLDGKMRLGFIGRIEELKGIDFLLKEFAALPPNRYELYIAGSGGTDVTSHFREQADLWPGIHWLGHTEPSDFFRQIDLLVVPSIWHEPLGRVILESHSYGIPTLVSNRGGMPELVSEGVTGSVFSLDEGGDFRRKLEALSLDVCVAMREACLSKAHDYEPDVIAGHYLEVFSRVIDMKRKGGPV